MRWLLRNIDIEPKWTKVLKEQFFLNKAPIRYLTCDCHQTFIIKSSRHLQQSSCRLRRSFRCQFPPPRFRIRPKSCRSWCSRAPWRTWSFGLALPWTRCWRSSRCPRWTTPSACTAAGWCWPTCTASRTRCRWSGRSCRSNTWSWNTFVSNTVF